ncbi:DoxX family protein [Pseudalkalibacillus salsuginis]|uniref:DoxX family protein n=1 Tax=Pseudalkalibacillus salsuginis TaxID=2910972 RepID=UPI001F24F806|nr:DoxX family protein [Pseudalkalibacillus salsuginis]MCF6411091.1 DoxX family protein [Pseudalkalibacillus salsuginis]
MENKYEASNLVLRVILGITFFIHGLVKFQNGIGNVAEMFGSMGLPGFMAYGVALLELIGGIALVLGLFSRVVSALFALLMIGAIVKVKLAAGFLGNDQMAGYELDLVLLAMSVALSISGSKAFALDRIIFKGQGSKSSTFMN